MANPQTIEPFGPVRGNGTAGHHVVTPLRLAVVNDYQLVTAGIAALLAPYPDRVAVQEFVGRVPARGEVDVVLFDAFASLSPAQRLGEIIAGTGAPVLVYSWLEDQDQVQAALALGAAGFLPKTATATEIIVAVERAHAGQPVHHACHEAAKQGWPGKAEGLTAREAEVIALIAAGLSNQQIAHRSYLSINSVKTHIRTAYRKMGVTTRSRAVLWAFEHGFLGADGTPEGSAPPTAHPTWASR